MDVERDKWGYAVNPADRMQDAMLVLFDAMTSAGDAEFSQELLSDLHALRLRFVDEYEQRYPGHGEGRAIWR